MLSRNPRLHGILRLGAFLAVVLPVLAGCEQIPLPPMEVPRTNIVRPPPPADFTESTPAESPRETRIIPGPGSRPVQVAPARAATGAAGLGGGRTLSASVDQMPLSAFINTVFGELLKVNYQVDPAIAQRQDLVTLRTDGARTPDELLAIARQVLATYGAQVTVSGDIYRIVPSDVLLQQMPDIVRSRTLPDVPTDLRPIFQYFPLQEARISDVMTALSAVVGQKVRATPLAAANAILLFGLPQDLQTVSKMVLQLDQAYFGNSLSVRIDPVYWSAQPLAQRLQEILRAQGYTIGAGQPGGDGAAISVIPVPQINAVLAFAPTQRIIDMITAWARQLDQPSGSEDSQKVFVYFVRNTKATSLADVVSSVIEGGQSQSGQTGSGGTAQGGQTPSLTPGSAANAGAGGLGQAAGTATASGAASGQRRSQSSRLVVDEARNALIFAGNANEWARYRPLIEQLDQPTREVFIEVSILEVTLTDNTQFGISWLFSGVAGSNPFTVGTLTSTAAPAVANGLNVAVFNSANQLRGTLTALSTNNRVNVLATPRLLARSGAEAKIQIGQDVPTVSSQGQSTVGQSSVLQTIQYRQTGVVLAVKPTIHAARRVDLEVSQEVSNIDNTGVNSSIQSPGFSNRKVTTQLALMDGATVMLGGLIKEDRSIGDSGVPFLKDLPLIGQAFRSNTDNRTRTELIVLITPYIISGPDDLQALTEAYSSHIRNTGNDRDVNFPVLPQYYRREP